MLGSGGYVSLFGGNASWVIIENSLPTGVFTLNAYSFSVNNVASVSVEVKSMGQVVISNMQVISL